MPFRKTEWEIDLEIVNVSQDNDHKWRNLNTLDPKTAQLLYFITIKQILEENFNLKIYELTQVDDFLNYDKWKQVYLTNKLSLESLESDIERRLRHVI